MNTKEVIDYYDYTIPFYKLFWHKGTNALHFGLWDENTKTLPEALLNTNKVLADIARIKREDFVLDAGSGVGGSALWLAKNLGVRVVGITLSPKQREKSIEYALRHNLEDKTSFLVKDFLHTEFPDKTFDAVWAVESACHAENKLDFIQEAFRVLRQGGRIIVADGFLRRPPKEEEQELYGKFLKGFALDNLALVGDFSLAMEHAGFKNIQTWDKAAAIQRTSEQMYRLSSRWLWFNKTLRFFRLIPELMVDNMEAGVAQREFFKDLGEYAIFYGEKP